jgi:hypothetical protein
MQTQLSDLQQHMNDVHAEIVHICMAQLSTGRASFIQPAVETMTRNTIQQMVSESTIEQDLMSFMFIHKRRRRTLQRFDHYSRCRTISGTVHCHTKITTDGTQQSKVEATVKLIPTPRLAGYCLTLSKASQNQEKAWILRPTPLRPQNSPILIFSANGNIEAVRTLLGSRQASSPWDTDPWSWAPLHVCAPGFTFDQSLEMLG